jgi:hypothetical protein
MGAEWIEFKPSLRDELISRAQVGEITPEQAEAEAAATGLPPFATTPALPAFDPLRDNRWSIAMGLAWIAWADMGLVRDQNAEFRSQCMRWVPRRWNRPNSEGTGFTAVEGWFLETRPAPTPTMLSLREGYMKERKTLRSSTRMSVRDAETALWGALSEGSMVAEAFNGEGKPVGIPEREWSYLVWVESGDAGCLRYNASDRKDAYYDVKLKRDDLLRLWPAVKNKPLFHERQAFIEASMFAPMATSAGYVPLCVALHWIMAKGGMRSVRLDDVAAWTAAVAQVHPLICEGTLVLIGQPRGETFTRPFPSFAFSLVRILTPVDDSFSDVLLSASAHVASCSFVDEENWHNGCNDQLYEPGQGAPSWTHLQLRRSQILEHWPKPTGTAVAGTECRKWLIEEIRNSPLVRTKSKREFLADAKKRFPGIAERQFVSAWGSAIAETGAESWKKAGPTPQRSDHRTS